MKKKLIMLSILLLSPFFTIFAPKGSVHRGNHRHKKTPPKKTQKNVDIQTFLTKIQTASGHNVYYQSLRDRLKERDMLSVEDLNRVVDSVLRMESLNSQVQRGGKNRAHAQQVAAIMSLARQ